jgi:23S rRNA (adenine2030-N6)-methyltransferase
MNYRHAFHAGNFADVFKHVVVARILVRLMRKETPLRFIDTHAGAGVYSLDAEEAHRTGEWRDGVGRVLDASPSTGVAAILEPWLQLVSPMAQAEPRLYLGSPRLAQALLRPQDRLVLIEKHPVDARYLHQAIDGDRRCKALTGDGWSLLPGLVPPPERRGLVLIDPPFEEDRELATIIAVLEAALRRWSTGVYAVWYPIKARRPVEAFARKAAALNASKVWRAELQLFPVERIDRLNGCGMLVLNPPWQLDDDLAEAGPFLARVLAREDPGYFRAEWLKPE